MIALLLAAAAAAPDACALLEGPEIAAFQGETPSESKPGASDQGALQVRSCVFVLPVRVHFLLCRKCRRGNRREDELGARGRTEP